MADKQDTDSQSQERQEMVIVSGSNYNRTYHRSEDCRAVKIMNYWVEKPLAVIEGHYGPCKRCVGAPHDEE